MIDCAAVALLLLLATYVLMLLCLLHFYGLVFILIAQQFDWSFVIRVVT